ncbi:MAG: hypothetical protein JST86_04405 [Bacteroidetes bacterium]|nr:hypothetical protein [Bacteroidota bacterium]
MKPFLIKVSFFLLLVTAAMLFVFFIADGKSDAYYLRFTTPQQHSLIIGTSRAAQGLQPEVFDSIVYAHNEHHFFNYAFTITDSPFGEAYYESIQHKLAEGVRDGIFIVTVDPWSLSSNTTDPNDSVNFHENKGFMGKTKYVNLNPNIPYLVQSYGEPYVNIIRKWKSSTDLLLHKDGWLQVDVPMDSPSVAKRLQNKINDYRMNFLPNFHFSTVRFNYFQKTLSYLQQHGKVYLVRLPIHPEISKIEDELMPDFEEKVNAVAATLHIPYLDFRTMDNHYQYVDGNHLYQSSGKEVSETIAGWIKMHP